MSQQFESFYDRNPSVKAPDRRLIDRREESVRIYADNTKLRAINAELRIALAEMVTAFASGLPKAKFRSTVLKARAALTKAGAS